MMLLLTAADTDYTRPDCVRVHPDHGRELNRRLAELERQAKELRVSLTKFVDRVDTMDRERSEP